MVNHWWVTRPKRDLTSIPSIVAIFMSVASGQVWRGNRELHIKLEEALEKHGVKKVGIRRDASGSGGRTYAAWLVSLGLIFSTEDGRVFLTCAGEEICAGKPPVAILKNQVLKYQYPSYFSSNGPSKVSGRFKIHPFIFILRLLTESRLGYYITQEELGRIVIVDAEDESDKCYNYVVDKILAFRDKGESIFTDDYKKEFLGDQRDKPYNKILDTANTFLNWLNYTQLIEREEGRVSIIPEKMEEVRAILAREWAFISDPLNQEKYQRKYGLAPGQHKDTRSLLDTKAVTPTIAKTNLIKQAFISLSIEKPISRITPEIIELVGQIAGTDKKFTEEVLLKNYAHGAIGGFMQNYFDMAFKGRDEATDFEKATVEIFRDVFGFESKHVGPIGLTPDVLILSNDEGYQAIIDNKAYSKYSINNDHHNRMVHNYINNISNYSSSSYPLAFFSYVSGGFTDRINAQLLSVYNETGVNGSAISVSNIIKMIEKHQDNPYTHKQLREIFGLNRQVLLSDI